MAIHSALLAAISLFPATALYASETGDNVVVIQVKNVQIPDGLTGLCHVNGVIAGVLDGKTYRKGQPVSVEVPCFRAGYVMSEPGPAVPDEDLSRFRRIDTDVLRHSRGVAHLDDAGGLIGRPSTQTHWGKVEGYRTLDAAALPVGDI